LDKQLQRALAGVLGTERHGAKVNARLLPVRGATPSPSPARSRTWFREVPPARSRLPHLSSTASLTEISIFNSGYKMDSIPLKKILNILHNMKITKSIAKLTSPF
jgi:hypothetical protein